ncbi:hypothetical protein VR46_43810 [Streptomyces sp. NRRL S-444]|nr:hypothetical protein VR46_43810 [Streptomyces sp. NRRL S-444]
MTKEPLPDDAVTVETPLVKRVVQPDDVTQTVPVPKIDPAAETSVLPAVPAAGPADETAVLPPVRPSSRTSPQAGPAPAGQARSATRPTARRPEESPADRVPPGIFRDSGDDVTRELPLLGDDGGPSGQGAQSRPAQSARPSRPRPAWAEETPLDDLPTLADELLGPRRDDEDEEGGPRRRR